MQCGTYPAWAAQTGIRLPPTQVADKPDCNTKISVANFSTPNELNLRIRLKQRRFGSMENLGSTQH